MSLSLPNRWSTRAIAGTALLALIASLAGCISDRQSALDNYLKAKIEQDQGHYDQAIAALTTSIQRNPDLGLAYIARGQLSRQKGDYAAAAVDFKRATELEPNNFAAHYQLALMYQYLKDFVKAVASYQRAIEIRPLDPDANMNLAIVYAQTGDPLKGIPYATRAVAGAPDSPATHANLGALYSQVGYSDLAIQEFKRSIELNSKEPEVYINLAEEYIKAARYDQARQVLETAAAIKPSPAISERLGLVYYKLNNLDKAQAAYADSLRQNPSYFQAMNGLGVVDMTKSLQSTPANVEEARSALYHWGDSLRVNPDQPAIQQLLARYTGATSQPAK